jgi:hypothetical protein
VTDQKKQRKDKPAHKENEAIEFEFNIGVDDCSEIAFNMYKASVTGGFILCRTLQSMRKFLWGWGGERGFHEKKPEDSAIFSSRSQVNLKIIMLYCDHRH